VQYASASNVTDDASVGDADALVHGVHRMCSTLWPVVFVGYEKLKMSVLTCMAAWTCCTARLTAWAIHGMYIANVAEKCSASD